VATDLMLFELKITDISKSSGWGLQNFELLWEHIFITIGMFPVELLAYQVSVACAAD